MSNKYDDELDDEEDSVLKKCALKSMDDDLAPYFDEENLDDFNDVTNSTVRSKRGNKNLKIIYEIGDLVIADDKKCKIIFGPYEKEKNNFYELESEEGKIFSAPEKQIKKI